MPPRPTGQFTSIESLTFSDDRRQISLRFIGGKDPATGEVCSVEYGAWTNVAGDVLGVGVFAVSMHTPEPQVECDLIGYGRSVDVELPEPFTGREWHDLAGYRHFLTAPDGWPLIGERDVEESPTGRWERTYATSPDAPPKQSIVLYQAFDGPVNVTGGSDPLTVDVGGRRAELYTWPLSGELVLLWSFEGHGLALFAYEAASRSMSCYGWPSRLARLTSHIDRLDDPSEPISTSR